VKSNFARQGLLAFLPDSLDVFWMEDTRSSIRHLNFLNGKACIIEDRLVRVQYTAIRRHNDDHLRNRIDRQLAPQAVFPNLFFSPLAAFDICIRAIPMNCTCRSRRGNARCA
jgi:hypothetical protein